ncbi:hypothetical protein AX769_01220 [Frondihabitans sp. PAMC 28766]|uniref:hypothetical protein n=1 Tax=Frondihabitans sp. PAMC 28766 TaxID=1795630 RepID=UPI00078D7994|nr:hypothetical protein [Frondihabitans sp. PAMC 28766]AMM19014.1 hypothetical protein AX769_01220 [Frondihabitans sp. PAMC 28766]
MTFFTRTTAGSQGRLASRAGLWAVVGALALTVPLALSGCTQAQPHAESTYGGMPSYLPKSSLDTDAMLTGSVKKPALTSEGDSVKVKLPGGGSVVMSVTGPVVPGEGLPYQADYTTCTWTLTLSHATRAVPIRLSEFTTFDQAGFVYHLAAVPHTPALPTSVGPGQKATFELRTSMKVGEGLLRWAPADSASPAAAKAAKIVAAWDFEVEND